MFKQHPKYGKEEYTRRGTELYQQKIRPLVEADHQDRYVVMDIDGGDYKVADDPDTARRLLIAKQPDAQLWCVRIGHGAEGWYMNRRFPKYSKEEFARRGTELYEQKIRPLVEADNQDRYVVVDIDTGDFEVGDDQLEACQPLIDKKPDAQLWCKRIGHIASASFGGYPTKESP